VLQWCFSKRDSVTKCDNVTDVTLEGVRDKRDSTLRGVTLSRVTRTADTSIQPADRGLK